MIEKTYAFDFDGIAVSTGINAEIVKSDQEKVSQRRIELECKPPGRYAYRMNDGKYQPADNRGRDAIALKKTDPFDDIIA